MENWIKDLDYYLMPSRRAVKGHEEPYLLAYQCWRLAWEKYRSELGIQDKLNADPFRVTDEIGALFYKGRCVGLHCFTYGSWLNGPFADLGYFNGWTPEAIAKLKSFSPENSLICSQFTVHPDFTGKNHIVRWKEINFLFIFMRYQHSIADIMCGHLNTLRKVEEAAGEAFGATVLDPHVVFNYAGLMVPSQLVAYEKHKFDQIKQQKNITGLCGDLWGRLKHLSEHPVTDNNIIPLKKAA